MQRSTKLLSNFLITIFLVGGGCAWNADTKNDAGRDGVEIRRTTDGIPHIRASNWNELGIGIGYAQAEDAFCTLAEAFVTYEGKRSWYFGANERPSFNSTLGRPTNLDLDFFFRYFADNDVQRNYRQQNPDEIKALVNGYVRGYNRYLTDLHTKKSAAPAPSCVGDAWVRELTEDDVYRRFYAAQIAAGYGHFVEEIVHAASVQSQSLSAHAAPTLSRKLALRIGEQESLGSNVLAFGPSVTGTGSAVLLGNPHWYWSGPDRFYQMHLTIPGKLNVAGAALLGIPIVMVGFNENVAWSHTVSAARRFGLFDLTLDASNAMQYRVDGEQEALNTRTVTVDVRDSDGTLRHVTRNFRRSRFGPIIDLSNGQAVASDGHAAAIRDANADNFRIFRNYLYWNQASSLNEFIAIQRRELAIPWVNTATIGRDDNRVWFADIGPVPNVPDTLKNKCATPHSEQFAHLDAYVPYLDGSRGECNWLDEPGAIQSGIMPAAKLPGLLRQDYVANMNDSYWLANANQPLEGFPLVLGGEREPLSLRSRLGFAMANELIAPDSKSSSIPFDQRLQAAALSSRAYSAEIFKTELLKQVCTRSQLSLSAESVADIASEAGVKPDDVPRVVSISDACEVLKTWNGKADIDDRGALLWDALWARVEKIPAESLYRVAFSAQSPLTTPRNLQDENKSLQQAVAATIALFAIREWSPGMAVRDRRFLTDGDHKVAFYGGCHEAGYFTMLCADKNGLISPNTLGNSYLQTVQFDRQGVQAYTLLANGERDTSLIHPLVDASVTRYTKKQWLRFPFAEREIAQDPHLIRTTPGP